jgi:hypothetical protein
VGGTRLEFGPNAESCICCRSGRIPLFRQYKGSELLTRKLFTFEKYLHGTVFSLFLSPRLLYPLGSAYPPSEEASSASRASPSELELFKPFVFLAKGFVFLMGDATSFEVDALLAGADGNPDQRKMVGKW